jgi:hypothetical protein
MKFFIVAFTLLLTAGVAHARQCEDPPEGSAPGIVELIHTRDFSPQARDNGTYQKCGYDNQYHCDQAGYECWGSGECLPLCCHSGCAYNSPCWPDGTCNYGE